MKKSDNAPAIRKRGYWRGLGAGIAAHYLTIAVPFLIMYVGRLFLWPALYGEPYKTPKGVLDPNTNEWLMLQAIAFVSWITAGAAATRWSRPGSWRAAGTLFAWTVIMALLVPLPVTDSMARLAIWILESPLGLVVGTLLFVRREQRLAVQSVGPDLQSVEMHDSSDSTNRQQIPDV